MTVDPGASDPGRPPADPPHGRAGEPDRLRSGRVAELALVAAGLGLMIYLLGFVDDVASGTLVGPLLLGGGLLAGSVVLPTAGPRPLVPAAVATGTGALLLLQAVVGGADSAVAIAALVLAVLEVAAVGGAALLQAGTVRLPQRRPRRPAPPPPPPPPPPYAYPPPPGYPAFPGQQYPGQPYPGSYPGHAAGPADPYAGEHAYAQYARYGAPYGVPGYPPPPPAGPPTAVGPPVERPSPGDAPAFARPAEPVDPASVGRYSDVAPSAGEPGPSPDTTVTPRTGSSVRGGDPAGTGERVAPPAGGAGSGDDRTRAVPRASDER
jgi:hypothetical protein